jgi:prepilin-type N-terminal cleavage/methylation domain-containing protein
MRARGFTLMELAVVVMIAGILLAVALPTITHFRRTLRSGQASQQVLRDIRGARQRAVTGRTPVIIAFGNGSTTTNITSYTIHTDTNGDLVYQTSEYRSWHTLPSGTSLSSVSLAPADSLIFDISGVLWPGTGGGSLRLLSGTIRDTVDVSAAGTSYRR